MAQDWESPTSYSATPAQPQMAAAYALRPLSLGEVLDRTFSVYRSRFWLFAGIGAISALVQTLISAVQLIPMNMARVGGTLGGARPVAGIPGSPLSPNYLAGLGVGTVLGILVITLLYLLVFVVTQAATVYALSEVYLGKSTTIGESLRATIGRWYRYLGIGIWQTASAMWITTIAVIAGVILIAMKVTGLEILGGLIIFAGILGGVPVGIIFWLRNSLGVQATVIEGLPVRASMARSKVLTAGSKGRIFVLVLLAAALSYVAALLQMPLSVFVMFTIARGGRPIGSEIAMLLVGFVGQSVVQPVLMIGLSLLYFDQRVRKEAFDLVMLLGPETTPVEAQPLIWPPPAPESSGWPPPPPTETVGFTPIEVAPVSAEPVVSETVEDIPPARTDDETSL